MSEYRVYDVIKNAWQTNISDSVNKQKSTSFKAKVASNGHLLVVNEADVPMAGGLVSTNVDVPAGLTHFGLDLLLYLTPDHLKKLARSENDLKVTFPGGAQANGSFQWNDDKKIWQVGANDGSGWVDTPYKASLLIGVNRIQLRLYFDGKVWGFEGLSVNDDLLSSWIPDKSFQNLPANQTNWTQGMHPQLQTECRDTPWYLVEEFAVVNVVAGTGMVPYSSLG